MKLFPAAILQPPFYNYQADEAVNTVVLEVIGHEISHGLTIQDHDTMPKKFSGLVDS
jgi:predicted metalloendopeptidase